MFDIPNAITFRNCLDAVCASSFRNFHAKGLDYLCLKRTPTLTVKAYFYDGDPAGSPDLVVPHNHRYGFDTVVIAGGVTNLVWSEAEEGRIYQRFNFYTPLNGGDGFVWDEEVCLSSRRASSHLRGSGYHSRSSDIHTLSELRPGTILLLTQYADELPIDAPSKAYKRGLGHDVLSLDGLYDQMDEDHALVLYSRFLEAYSA